jgi:hypothetical protein
MRKRINVNKENAQTDKNRCAGGYSRIIDFPSDGRPGATPWLMKPTAREAKVLKCAVRKSGRGCSEWPLWHVSHPGSGLQDAPRLPASWTSVHGVGGSFGRNPPFPTFMTKKT